MSFVPLALILALASPPVPPPILVPAPSCQSTLGLSGEQRFAVCKAFPLTLDCDDASMELCFIALRCSTLTLCEYIACVEAVANLAVCTAAPPAECMEIIECLDAGAP